MNTTTLKVFFSLILVLFYGRVSAQALKLPKIKWSIYLTTYDSTRINIDLADRVTSQLGFSEFMNMRNVKTYRINSASGIMLTTFLHFTYIPRGDTKLKTEDHTVITPEPDKQLYVYGFSSKLGEGSRVNKNFSKLFMSAYLQEQDTDYRNNSAHFTSLA